MADYQWQPIHVISVDTDRKSLSDSYHNRGTVMYVLYRWQSPFAILLNFFPFQASKFHVNR